MLRFISTVFTAVLITMTMTFGASVYVRNHRPVPPSAHTLEQRTVVVKTATGHGSGVLLNATTILTAAHVAKEGLSVPLQVVSSSGDTVAAKVLWMDTKADVALLKLERPLSGALSAPLRCELPDAAVGDSVQIVGNPLNLSDVHTWGRISAPVATRSGQVNIIADATIAPGNSGGPVFNADGSLLGIAVAMSSMPENGGIAFALVPLTYIIPKSVICSELSVTHEAPAVTAAVPSAAPTSMKDTE